MNPEMKAALDVAWEKIQIYCKKYAGCSVRDVVVGLHDVHFWRSFGVTPQGIAYINGGNHAQHPGWEDTKWVGHPEHQECDTCTKYSYIEQIVLKWPAIKAELEARFAKEKRIFAFEP